MTKGKDALVRSINAGANVRIKTKRGNRDLDDRRDKRIVAAYKSKTPLREKTTAGRAVQAYKGAMSGAQNNKSMANIASKLGAMTFNDGKRGRPKKVATMARGAKKG